MAWVRIDNMEELCNAFPKKTRYDVLNKINIEGLTENEMVQLKNNVDVLLGMNYTEDSIINELNLFADDLRAEQVWKANYDEERRTAMVLKKMEREILGIPVQNIDGDVGLKRLKAFLTWLNQSLKNPKNTDEILMQEFQTNWIDVVDCPMTKYYSDFDGIRIFIIGGGGVDMNAQGDWYYTSSSPVVPSEENPEKIQTFL
jgi:hypothetical protein